MNSAKLSVLLVCLLPLVVRGDDWPQWRGPDRSGVSKETGLLKSWPKAGPKMVWEAKGAGRGYASVAISKGKVFTYGDTLSTAEDKDEYVTCYDDKDGKQLWKSKVAPLWTRQRNESWQSPRSTPTVDGDLLFVLSPAGILACLETTKGTVKWTKDITKEFGGSKGDSWGYSESPLVDGDKVLCTPGGSTTMAALNKLTGETLWKCTPGNGGAGHASMVISEVGATRVYVNTTSSKVVGVQASDGKLLWSKSHSGRTAVVPTPILRGDLVYYAAGYGAGAGLLKQTAGQGNTVTAEEVYAQNRNMTNKHGGIVLVGDHVYGCTEDRAGFWCADLKTGKQVWNERVSGNGSVSVTAADGRLYLHVADGTMILAEASPKGYKELSTFKAPKTGGRPSWAHPVVCNGRLYVREGDKVLCYDIKDGASTRR